jgi:hypothetical protein
MTYRLSGFACALTLLFCWADVTRENADSPEPAAAREDSGAALKLAQAEAAGRFALLQQLCRFLLSEHAAVATAEVCDWAAAAWWRTSTARTAISSRSACRTCKLPYRDRAEIGIERPLAAFQLPVRADHRAARRRLSADPYRRCRPVRTHGLEHETTGAFGSFSSTTTRRATCWSTARLRSSRARPIGNSRRIGFHQHSTPTTVQMNTAGSFSVPHGPDGTLWVGMMNKTYAKAVDNAICKKPPPGTGVLNTCAPRCRFHGE